MSSSRIEKPETGATRITVVEAGQEHRADAVELFHAYRTFYSPQASRQQSEAYLDERIRLGDSALFLARSEGRTRGFMQMYPTYSSVSCRLGWILNDLFVREDSRRLGTGLALVRHASLHAARTGRAFIVLATQGSNVAAKALYEACGYVPDEEFTHYQLEVDVNAPTR